MKEEIQNIPRHVAVIMDGNGRWAKRRFMPRTFGHRAGMNAMIAMARKAKAMGIEYLTVYALSTENFARPAEELEGLFDLIRRYFTKNVRDLYAEGAAVKVIGDISALPADVQKLVCEGVANSPADAKFFVILALNYGARSEIVRAANAAISRGERVDEDAFAALLDTHGVPCPDLIIRTGGEVRLSNFLLWQAAYAELYFCDVLFPDFDESEFEKAIAEYSRRNRRFGRV